MIAQPTPRVLLTAAVTLLASFASAQRMIAVDSSRTLYQIDLVTGAKSAFGQVSANAGTAAALAYDATAGVMYLSSTSTDSLYTVDLTTGTATLVGPYGDPAIVMHGLEFDSRNGRLFGASQHNGGFYEIDRTTGTATMIATSGLGGSTNLGYDTVTDTMYATNGFGDNLYVVDRSTGSFTLRGSLAGPGNPNALAFDDNTGVLYLLDNSSDNLYAVELTTGATTVIGSTGVGNLLGLAFLPGGNGSIVRNAHSCGATTILATGSTNPGGAVTTHLGGLSGVPVIGLGFTTTTTPFCTCTVGHEWAGALFGTSYDLLLPPGAAFSGLQIAIQGAELFAVGGCPTDAVSFTDTLVLTIG
jgi:hypothetical protein